MCTAERELELYLQIKRDLDGTDGFDYYYYRLNYLLLLLLHVQV